MKKTPYQEVVVSVRDASGRDVDAITCQVSAWAALRRDGVPSARYLGIIEEGARESVRIPPRRRRRARRRVAHALSAQPEPPARAAAERVFRADLRRPAALAPRALGGADGRGPAPDGGGRIGDPVVPLGPGPAAGRVRAARVISVVLRVDGVLTL